MSNLRKRPPTKRLLRHPTGVYFKAGSWTACADDATVFASLGAALRARRKFGLEDVQLVNPAQPFESPPHNS